ncbi:hypothetical protein DDZ16_07425 [Marinilabilia rubra]|uniref:Uncharacterized protein n=1 Tax=Marinilabilia rubra TaxID=2162893 RepID=A0A2U2BAS8_9BACT|nr:hypothetical protein DDZ16_07425 [Marinilabilia rubra]
MDLTLVKHLPCYLLLPLQPKMGGLYEFLTGLPEKLCRPSVGKNCEANKRQSPTNDLLHHLSIKIIQ